MTQDMPNLSYLISAKQGFARLSAPTQLGPFRSARLRLRGRLRFI